MRMHRHSTTAIPATHRLLSTIASENLITEEMTSRSHAQPHVVSERTFGVTHVAVDTVNAHRLQLAIPVVDSIMGITIWC